MASGGGKPPPAPDPATIIGLENKYNRYNSANPFGTSQWSTDANGHETQTTTANPRTQSAIDRAFSAAETPYQKEYVPQGMDQLTSAILGKVGKRYNLGGQGQPGLNTNLKPQQQTPPPMQMPQQGGMADPSQMGAMSPNLGIAALNRMPQQGMQGGAMAPQQQTWGG